MESLLFTIVKKDVLKSMVNTFYACMGIPIQVIDDKGEFLAESGAMTSFCARFQKYLPANDSCRLLHTKASKRTIDFGGPYVFACHAGLNHIVLPLTSQNAFLGAVLVGPFCMEAPDAILFSNLAKKYKIPVDQVLELHDDSDSIPLVEPEKVRHISDLLYYLFADVIDEGKKELRQNNERLLQQSRINESIQRYKEEPPSANTYPYELEKDLVSKVKLGDSASANAILNDLLGYVFFSEGSSLSTVKSRAIELCSVLSRAAIEGGGSADSILKLNNQFLQNLQSIRTFDSLCFELKEIADTFAESCFKDIPSKNSELIHKAIAYIAEHFQENIRLEDVAGLVHLHPSYFSSVFKESTGSSFKEYLNLVRIEESKRLLINTDYSIIDIAIATGFEDQSYFSKVFKKYTGLTPKQYRS